MTYVRNRSHDRRVEQADRWWMEPIFVLGRELRTGEMAKDGSHRHFTSAPWLAKVELKAVVLDVLISSIAL